MTGQPVSASASGGLRDHPPQVRPEGGSSGACDPSALDEAEDLVRKQASETDWKLAFKALAFLTSTGFVSSDQVANRANKIRELCGEEPAEFLIEVFNSTRSQWMQEFMG